ncbi:hypothetical protein [Hornefia butyriciproducens]|uniref:hypothetical protein n=1 Tax=Hornefia butyriciproducens TaxID=2652293 RepID=UPI002A90E36E|nr:hypothetical protein [Hornefia butyriciproducens]MDY5463201.1 hypothetical protein [Hornefia butyriciproducens]
MSCPICGIVAKETRQCPKYDGKPVCAAHCYQCKYYDADPRITITCRWRIYNKKKIDNETMIANLREIMGRKRNDDGTGIL